MKYYCTNCGATIDRPKKGRAKEVSVVGLLIALGILLFSPLHGALLLLALGIVFVIFYGPHGEKVVICPKCEAEKTLIPCQDASANSGQADMGK